MENTTVIESLMQVSKDQDTLGFDLRAGESWIYPTNYPVRDYQLSIVEAALEKNTLVSLPTGLGKTFIAAVVMYNFYRWYPTGKIIFMAPTKPLVKQQIDACYNIMAIPPEVTSEMTGAKVTASRVNIWNEKRVFFITPHILQNDIETIPDLGSKIRCIVIDEAHKALGKQANCEVLRKLKEINDNFRVLALSATPGSNFKNVVDIIQNLYISHIECRTDESPDVSPFVFKRQLETIVVPLGGKLQYVKEEYLKILDIYTRPLFKFNVLSGNCSLLTKGKILMTMRDYKENCKNRANYNNILCSFNICITLYHGYELLIRHGMRSFFTFFEGCIEKPLINSIKGIHPLLQDLRNYLGPPLNTESLPDGTIPAVPEHAVFGHPKFYKLAEILVSHFQTSADESTRVMVFCEYRESVQEAYTLLLKHRPLIKPKIFTGKGVGVTQAQQCMVIKQFREGKCNTLVSTCIGEEGIDVGEVDLIVCFDISTKSPVRMVQRMGRTGRKRNGRVFILVTEGKEQQTLQECMIQKSNMNNLLSSNQIKNHLYKNNPKMIPVGLTPRCDKLFITIPKKQEKKEKKVKNTVKSMFDNFSSSQSTFSDDIEISKAPDFEFLPKTCELWSKNKGEVLNMENNLLYSRKLDKQRNLSIKGNFGHSTTTEAFLSLLKFADKKKYNLPTKTQISFSQKNKSEPMTLSQVNNFRQVDIRNMFKPKIQKPVDDIIEIIDNDPECPYNHLISTIDNYLKISSNYEDCELCQIFNCSIFYHPNKRKTPTYFEPDMSILDNITEKKLEQFLETLNPKNMDSTTQFENNLNDFLHEMDNCTGNNLDNTLKFLKLSGLEDIFEISSDEDTKRKENVILDNKNQEKNKDESQEKLFDENFYTKNCFTPAKTSKNTPGTSSPPKIVQNTLLKVTQNTPPKTKLTVSNDVSPIIGSGRIRDIKSRVKRLSQVCSTPNSAPVYSLSQFEVSTFQNSSNDEKTRKKLVYESFSNLDLNFDTFEESKLANKRNEKNSNIIFDDNDSLFDFNTQDCIDKNKNSTQKTIRNFNFDSKNTSMKVNLEENLTKRVIFDENDSIFDINTQIFQDIDSKNTSAKQEFNLIEKNKVIFDENNSILDFNTQAFQEDDIFEESNSSYKNETSFKNIEDKILPFIPKEMMNVLKNSNQVLPSVANCSNKVPSTSKQLENNCDISNSFEKLSNKSKDNDKKPDNSKEIDNLLVCNIITEESPFCSKTAVCETLPSDKIFKNSLKRAKLITKGAAEPSSSNNSNETHPQDIFKINTETPSCSKSIVCQTLPSTGKLLNENNPKRTKLNPKNTEEPSSDDITTVICPQDIINSSIEAPSCSKSVCETLPSTGKLLNENSSKTTKFNSKNIDDKTNETRPQDILKSSVSSCSQSEKLNENYKNTRVPSSDKIPHQKTVQTNFGENSFDLFDPSIKIDAMFDIADESLFESSGEITELNKNIGDEIVFDSSSNESVQKTIKNEKIYDPEATIIISSDEEFVHTDKFTKKINLSKLNQSVKKDVSLYTCTQMLEILNKSQDVVKNVSPKKESKYFEDITEKKSYFDRLLKNRSNLLNNSTLNAEANKTKIIYELVVEDKENIQKNNQSNFKSPEKLNKSDPVHVTHFDFFDNDLDIWEDDDFEISNSRKKSPKKSKISLKSPKSKKVSENWFEKFAGDFADDDIVENFNQSLITQKNKKDDSDSCEEESLLKFSQQLKPKIQLKLKYNSLNTTVSPKNSNLNDSDDDFVVPSTSRNRNRKRLQELVKKKKRTNPFIVQEADIEEDDAYESDSSNEDDIDALEASFINDTQMSQCEETDMQAKYLQSVKSPVKNRGGFKIPTLPPRFTNVFSQVEVYSQENTYLKDSFCVDDEDTVENEMSYLEKAEAEIERQRKKKRKRTDKLPKKRRRIVQELSDSD